MTTRLSALTADAPVAAEPTDALTCYREGLKISADNWYRMGRTAHTTMRSAVYGALASVCGPNASKLINIVIKALFDAEGFNHLAGCEIMALYHWIRPFEDGGQWRTEVSAVYECVKEVVKVIHMGSVEVKR